MIYLDNSATTRTLEAAARTAAGYMTQEFFNPSSAYSASVAAERTINKARASVAGAMGAAADEVVFTSGGTESNNAAILGSLRATRGRGRIVAGMTEHPSVYEVFGSLSKEYDVRFAPVDGEGKVNLAALKSVLNADTRLVSVMQVNNEVGAVNDIAAIRAMMRRLAPGAQLHVDGVQGFLKVPFEAKNCDFYSISGHKFHAPKGVGALYVHKGARFAGGQIGGGQEKGLRSGTLNTPGIAGMAVAVDYYLENLTAFRQNMRECKLRLAENLRSIPDVLFNGPAPEDETAAPHILNASFLGVRGEVLLHALEERQIYVSTGSACSAHKKGKNRILTAMGVVGERQEGAIRFSLCPFNTPEEMDMAADALRELTGMLRRYRRR